MANLSETPQWEDGIYQIEASDPVLGGPDGITNRPAKQLASRTSYLKQQVEKGSSELAKHVAAADPHSQYAPKASPALTGMPTAPTPANSDNSKKLATTEFVAKALAALAGSAPETLDTLKKLADALGNDPNFATTVLNKLSEKLAKDQNGADIPDPPLFVKNLGLGQGSALPVGVPVPWPAATPPDGWLKCNGATFDKTIYPLLGAVFTSGKLPDLRGEFIRGWDDGRGVDIGRGIGTSQGATGIRTAALDYFGTDNTMSTATVGTAYCQAENITNSQPSDARFPGGGALGATLADNAMTCPQATSGITPGSVWISVRPRNTAFNYILRAA